MPKIKVQKRESVIKFIIFTLLLPPLFPSFEFLLKENL